MSILQQKSSRNHRREEIKKPASPTGIDQIGAGSGNSGSAGNSGSTDGFLDGNSSQLLAAAGGFDNGAVTGGGGEGNTSGSVPRVIVTGFDTNPAEVKQEAILRLQYI